MNLEHSTNRGWFVLPGKKRKDKVPADEADTAISRRFPLLDHLPDKIRAHFVAMMGEFVGTFLFLLFGLGGTQVVNTAPAQGQPTELNADPAKILFIALSFGFSLAVNAWVFFRISGGLFNPAVSLGMCLIGAVGYLRGLLIIISQILGGIAASAVVSVMLPGPLSVRTTLGGGTTVVQGLFIEMFLTAQLVFTIFMLAAEKHKGTFIAPIGIGLSLFIAELMGVYYTGGSVNPARSFGPGVVLHTFSHYHWIYWLGPTLGSILAAGFYFVIKVLEYETVNPQQDDDGTLGAIVSTKKEGSPQAADTCGRCGNGMAATKQPREDMYGRRNRSDAFSEEDRYGSGPALENGRL